MMSHRLVLGSAERAGGGVSPFRTSRNTGGSKRRGCGPAVVRSCPEFSQTTALESWSGSYRTCCARTCARCARYETVSARSSRWIRACSVAVSEGEGGWGAAFLGLKSAPPAKISTATMANTMMYFRSIESFIRLDLLRWVFVEQSRTQEIGGERPSVGAGIQRDRAARRWTAPANCPEPEAAFSKGTRAKKVGAQGR